MLPSDVNSLKALQHKLNIFTTWAVITRIEVAETVTIGRTTVSSTRGSSSDKTNKNSIISIDALMYLRDAGFLYGCVGVKR